MGKKMKNPNGFGSVYKINDKKRRTNRYPARITIGYNEKNQPIYKFLGYFPTRKEAMQKLSEYNANKGNLLFNVKVVTFLECGEKCIDGLRIGENRRKAFTSLLQRLQELHTKPINTLKYIDYQTALDNLKLPASMQHICKGLLNHIEQYAMRNDIITKLYCPNLLTDKAITKSKKKIFTDDEIKKLWELHQTTTDSKTKPIVDMLLCLLYTGLRIGELFNLENKNINFKEKYFIAGSKTEAGMNRTIPIHHRIEPIIKEYHNTAEQYLIKKLLPSSDYFTNHTRLNEQCQKLFKQEKMTIHTFHECRHTFRTILDNLNANKVCIDLIMGHKSNDIGLDVYTHKSLEQLKDTIELIP